MLRKVFCFAIAALVMGGSSADASIISVIKGNDQEAIHWLATHHNPTVSGLSLIVKDNVGGVLEGPAQSGWNLSGTTRSKSWTLSTSAFTPQFFMVKFDGLIAIYNYTGSGTSPFSGSFDLDADVWSSDPEGLKIALKDKDNTVLYEVGTESENGNGKYGNLTASAAVSHVSVYGVQTAIPEPGTMTIWAVGCLAAFGAGLRRRS